MSGVDRLLTANGVEVIHGTARFRDRNEVDVALDDGSKTTLSAQEVIIATGARFEPPLGISFDGKQIMNPYDALNLEKPPEKVVILGANSIGIELATFLRRLDVKVTLLDSESDLFSELDKRVASLVKRNLRDAEIELILDGHIENISITDDDRVRITVTLEKNESKELIVDKVIFTSGKRPNTDELGLSEIGIELSSNGAIIVDDRQQTTVGHHYAIGDCTGPPYLAHRATKQGIVAAEVIAGLKSKFDFRAIPQVIFSEPEIAFVGMSEEEAVEAGYKIVAGQAPFSASGRALTEEEGSGLVRIIADSKTGAILGAQLVGPEVTDLISQMGLALELGSLLEDISYTTFPHPTLPEMIMEAAASAQGKAINVSNPRHGMTS